MIPSLKVENNLLNNVANGDTINDPELIKSYVGKYYEQLYTKETCNIQKQKIFLDSTEKKITDTDNNTLVRSITEAEVYDTISKMNTKKAPGIDGIPVEFFIKFWEIVKNEICEILNCIISNLKWRGIKILVLLH